MTKYKIVSMTPAEWQLQYSAGKPWADDLVLRRDADGYHFVSRGGAYFTDSDVYVPDYILNQPWSYSVAEIEAMDDEDTDDVYVRIVGDKAHLYEMPD